MKRKEILQVQLMGPLRVTRSDGLDADFATLKVQALLALIVLAGNAGLDRDVAADMLWSRSSQSQARTNLRQALANLRKALGTDAEAIKSSGSRISLQGDAAYSDVGELGELNQEDALQCGEVFLEGLALNEPRFEGWLVTQRASCRDRLNSNLSRLAKASMAESNYQDAIALTAKLIGLDPFQEASVRLHMQALAESGETAAAIKAYKSLELTLMGDLGVAPSEETIAQYEAVKTGNAKSAKVTSNRDLAPSRGVQKPASKWPVLAVLPFANLSSDPEQSYFSMGISEDIEARLSGSVLMSVATQNALQVQSDDPDEFKRFASQHGIDFVLKGSVRRSGQRIRITAHLTEVDTDRQVWAEKYDRNIADIFDLQDEVSLAIAGVLPGRVGSAVAERATRKPPSSIEAYEYLLQGKATRDGFSAERNLKARKLFEKVVELDPLHGSGWGYLQDTYVVDWMLGLLRPGDAEKIHKYAIKSLELDPNNLAAHDGLGYSYVALGRWQDAEAQFERTSNLLSNQAEQLLWCGYGHCMVGRHADALRLVERALSLDPLHPSSFEWVLGQVQFFNRDFAGANETLSAASLLNSIAYACKVASLAKLDLHEDAKVLFAEFCEVRHQELASRGVTGKSKTIEALLGGYRVFLRHKEDWELMAQGMRSLGIPDR